MYTTRCKTQHIRNLNKERNLEDDLAIIPVFRHRGVKSLETSYKHCVGQRLEVQDTGSNNWSYTTLFVLNLLHSIVTYNSCVGDMLVRLIRG